MLICKGGDGVYRVESVVVRHVGLVRSKLTAIAKAPGEP
jgi:hypothetical protein